MIIATFRQKQPLFGSPKKASATPSSSSAEKGKNKEEAIAISDSETETDSEDELHTSGGTAHSTEPLGWAYVGSHNFTPSAWGTLSGTGFNPILNVWPFFDHETELRLVLTLTERKLRTGDIVPIV